MGGTVPRGKRCQFARPLLAAASAGGRQAPPRQDFWRPILGAFREARRRARSRRALRMVLDSEFRDLGISRNEAAKPFWRS